jgi:broad specificity phosphatase PhoE
MRVTLLCNGSTTAVRSASFPADEPLDELGVRQSSDRERTLGHHDEVRCSPALRCRQTVDVLGLAAIPDPLLTGCDLGSWAGRSLDDVGASDPAGLMAWLTDPDFDGHGGESLTDLVGRIGSWLDTRFDPPHSVLGVCDAVVIRAAVVHALQASPRTIWRIDVAPLSAILLVGEPGRWNLRALRASGRQDHDGRADEPSA